MSFFLQGEKSAVLKEIIIATEWKIQYKIVVGLWFIRIIPFSL